MQILANGSRLASPSGSLLTLLSLSIPLALAVLYSPPAAIITGISFLLVFSCLFFRQRHDLIILFLIFYFSFELFLARFLSIQWLVFSKLFPELLLLTSLGALVFRYGPRTWPRLRPLAILVVPFFLVIILSSISNHASSFDTLYDLRIYFRYALAALLILFCKPNRIILRRFFLAIMVAVLLQCVLASMQLVGGAEFYKGMRPGLEHLEFQNRTFTLNHKSNVVEGTRLIGTMGNYMNLGTFCVLGLCIALAYAALSSSPRRRKIWYIISFIVGTILLLTFSRLSVLASLAVLSAIGILTKRRAYLMIALSVLSFCFLLPFALRSAERTQESAMTTSSLFWRLAGATEQSYLDPYSYARAYVLFLVPPQILKQAPLLGVGPGQAAIWNIKLPPTRGPIMLFDVGFVNILARYGLLGMVAFFTPIVLLLIRAKKVFWSSSKFRPRLFALVTFAYLSAILMFSLFSSPLYARYVSFYFWIVVGSFLSFTRVEKGTISPPEKWEEPSQPL